MDGLLTFLVPIPSPCSRIFFWYIRSCKSTIAFVSISILVTVAFLQLGDGDGGGGRGKTQKSATQSLLVRGSVNDTNGPDPIAAQHPSESVPVRSGKRPKHPNKISSVPSTLPATPPAQKSEIVSDSSLLDPSDDNVQAAADTRARRSRNDPTEYVPPTVLPAIKTDRSALQTEGGTYNSGIDFKALYDNPIDWRNTYIITLKRDTLRVEHCTNLTRDVWPGASLWWAIDGKELSDSTIDEWRREGYLAKRLAGFMNPKSKIGKPKISCLMSHVRVWEQLAKEEDPNAFYFVLEDDVYATEGFNVHYKGVVKELAGLAWDWVYLAIHPTFRRLNKLSIEGKSFINTAPRMVGNAGYLISRQGARKLLVQMFPCSLPKDQALRVLVLNRTIDAYIVKRDLVGVLGQQGQGFKGSQKRDPTRVFKSNIWDK